MNTKNKLTTPVLFLVFNRPETTKQVFKEIKKAEPEKLFIAADGPRNNEEKQKTDKVRKYIEDNIDWRCEVKTLFRDKNLGCKNAIAGGIDWFFENVEQGIILEDDCIPSQSFFRFCQEMLIKYKDDERIMQIGGTNVAEKEDFSKSYFFTTRLSPWGWATWKRSWKLYDKNMDNYERIRVNGEVNMMEEKMFHGFIGRRGYKLLRSGKMDTWDFQWAVSCILNNGLGIVPKVNLITNVGFQDGTHTTNITDNKSVKRKELEFPLKHNNIVINNKIYKKDFATFFMRGWYKRRFLGILYKIKKLSRNILKKISH